MKGLQFLVLLVGSVIAGILLSAFTLPINGLTVPFKAFIPNIVVPSEPLNGTGGWLHNTLFTTFIVDAVIIVLALIGAAGLKGLAPTNFIARAWEALVDYLYTNYMVPTLGSRAKVVAPIALSAFTFILISAMFELVPGIESVGKMEAAPDNLKGYCAVKTNGVWLITGYEVDKKTGFQQSCAHQRMAQMS